jgi:acyl carrier protein
MSMSDTRQRLIRCFQAVFPNLSDADAVRATTLNVSEWDSLATTILAAAIEEEFGIGFEPEDLEALQSFDSCARRCEGAAIP